MNIFCVNSINRKTDERDETAFAKNFWIDTSEYNASP